MLCTERCTKLWGEKGMEEYGHECVSCAVNAALSHPGFPVHKAARVEEEKKKKVQLKFMSRACSFKNENFGGFDHLTSLSGLQF